MEGLICLRRHVHGRSSRALVLLGCKVRLMVVRWRGSLLVWDGLFGIFFWF